MSDEFTQFHSLSADMERLLRWLLELAPPTLRNRVDLHCLKVVPLNDGEMGSMRIYESSAESPSRKVGSKISEISFLDADGTPVSAALLLDDEGRLFELDLFKADFSPLVAIPLTPDSPEPL